MNFSFGNVRVPGDSAGLKPRNAAATLTVHAIRHRPQSNRKHQFVSCKKFVIDSAFSPIYGCRDRSEGRSRLGELDTMKSFLIYYRFYVLNRKSQNNETGAQYTRDVKYQ